jgi:hypothetical protein
MLAVSGQFVTAIAAVVLFFFGAPKQINRMAMSNKIERITIDEIDERFRNIYFCLRSADPT